MAASDLELSKMDNALYVGLSRQITLRRELDNWFRVTKVEPVVAGEFEDAALAKIVATEGIGVTVVPTIVAAEAIERYSFVALGKTDACKVQLHLITAERRIEHPAVAMLARDPASRPRTKAKARTH